MRSDIRGDIIKIFRKKEKRASGSGFVDCSDLSFFSGETVTRSQAMEIPTVSACIGKIADTIARLPVKLYQKTDRKISEITDDNRLTLLNGDTGDTLTTVDMWKAVIEDYFLGNGGWIYINSNGIQTKSLHYVDSRNISIATNDDPIFKAFKVFVNGVPYYDFQFIRLFRKTKNGWANIPLQSDNPIIFSACYNALKLENTMNRNGGNKRGFLKAKTKLSAESLELVRQSFPAVYDNSTGGKIPVLNDNLEFEPLSSTAVELQINENKKANSTEICKIFGFPHTVIDGSASDGDNKKFIETIVSILNQIETALDNFLLLEKEKSQGFYFAFDTKELTRGSLRERYEAYQIAVKNHILQVDEIRREEDYEPLGFNFVTMGLGDVLLNPQTMEVFTPNTGQTSKLNSEVRAGRQWIKGEHGYFAGSIGGGGSGGGKSSENSAKSIDNSGESDIIESKTKFSPLQSGEVVPILRKESQEWIDSLNDEEIRSVKKYTKNNGDTRENKFYSRLNSMLRGDIPSDSTLEYYSEQISNAIKKNNLEHDIVCYRSLSSNFYSQYKAGDVIVERQFISTSVAQKGALKGNFHMVINAPKGADGAYIEPLSKYPKQREFLFNKDCKYKVISNNDNLIELEVIV